MPVSTSVRPQLYTSLSEAIYNEIVSRTGRYYYFLGKVLTWPNELAPPKALESVFYEKDARRNIILVKEIKPGDVALVTRRINWSSNTVYDMYDDRYSDEVIGVNLTAGGTSYSNNTFITISGGSGTGASANLIIQSGAVTGVRMIENGYGYVNTPNVSITDPDGIGSGAIVNAVLNVASSGANSLANANFYVVTDEYNIYKCLDNNGNSPSLVKPVDVTVEPFVTNDGYKWKFVGSVPPSLKNKFLTNNEIPLLSPLTRNFYSDGEIKQIQVINTGDGYTSAALTVDGDGFLASDPSLIINVTVDNAGNGYTTANVTIEPPVSYSSEWSAGNVYFSGTRLKSGNNIYEVVITGNTSPNPPVHTTGTARNGSASLKYLATIATGNAIITGGNISSIQLYGVVSKVSLSSGGYGYTSAPDIIFSGGGGTGASGYATLNGNSLSKIIITDIGTGYTSAPSITIGTQWVANNRTTIDSQVFNSTYLYTVIAANTNYRINDIRYDYLTANVSNSFAVPRGLYLNNTGTVLYVTGSNTNTVTQFTLSTPYNVSTATNSGNISVEAYDTMPQDIAFSEYGNVMYVLGSQNDKVYRFNLANAWNVMTATYVSNLNVSSFEVDPTCMFINNTGTKLFVAGTTSDKVETFNINTPWDVANAVVGANVSIAGYEANITGISLNSTGKILTIIGSNSDSINQFNLSNAWDVSTATYFSTYPVDNFDNAPSGLLYSEVADKIYVLGQNTTKIYQFSLPKSVYFGSTAPVHIAGNVYSGDALLAYAGNIASGTAVLKYGSGYTKEPNITIGGDGANATASITVVKSEAQLTAVIDNGQIVNVIIEDGGVGYTNAVINISGDGSNADLLVNLSEGDIQTLQGNNELLAVDGAIEAIKIVSGGYGYTSANVVIGGDGAGATANAVVNNGRVTKINVSAAGRGYTFANVVINGDGNGASARAIIPPEGGHGSDIVSELYARSLAMYSSIAGQRNQGFDVINEYRQVGLLKDIKDTSGERFFTGLVGSGCHVLSGNTSSTLIADDVTLTSSRNARYTVVAKTNSSVLVTSVDKVEPIVGDIMYVNGTQVFTVVDVVDPDIDKYSGELLYIDNREAFTTSGQFVSIKTVFKY